MPEVGRQLEKEGIRKIRAHKKSRRGCGNCKIRAVKCDELKPICKRCKSYGVICNYDKKSPDLELFNNGSFHISILNEPPPLPKTRIPKSIAPSLKQGLAASLASYASHDLGDLEFELLHRFQTRTVLTVTTPRSLPVYQSSILKYSCSHPYLLHAVLTLTLLHDRHFSSRLTSILTATENYHWGQSIALYSKAISSTIHASSRDALWVTAAFLGILSITHTDASTPRESWPYAPPSSLDLNWLRMSEGKKEIWKDGKSFLEESDFRVLAIEQQGSYQIGLTYGSSEGLASLPVEFLSYFELLEGADLIGNPYYAAAHSLAQTWSLSSVYNVLMNWIFYITHMEQRYKNLLADKDPRAMLILAYWYGKAYDTGHWYILRRAAVEGESICMYIEKNYADDWALLELLRYPRGVWPHW